MTRRWVSFRTVKQAVSMEMALATYGVMLHRLDRCYLRGRCPLPSHRSRSSAPSFIVNTEKNAWACHSDSCASTRGGLGGNVLDFVACMENCSVREAALRLQEWFGLSAAPAVPCTPPPPAAVETEDLGPLQVNPRCHLCFRESTSIIRISSSVESAPRLQSISESGSSREADAWLAES